MLVLKKLRTQLIAAKDERESERAALTAELAAKSLELGERSSYGSIVGRSEPMQRLFRLLDKVKSSDVPVCVGSGVSRPEHSERVGAFADGVVVGSVLVDRIAAAGSSEDAVDAAARTVAELKEPLRAR